MKLFLDMETHRWTIGTTPLNCGQQVQIQCHDTAGRAFWVWGRFEIAGQNNPVFYTTFGRIVPDLHETIFRLP